MDIFRDFTMKNLINIIISSTASDVNALNLIPDIFSSKMILVWLQ